MSRSEKRVRLGSAVVLALLLLPSCGESPTRPTPPSPPAAPRPAVLSVSPRQSTLVALGDTARMVAEVRDQNGRVMTGTAIAWSSNDTSVATIDASGLVTASGNGGTTIAAQAGSASGTAAVTVRQVPRAVAVAPQSLTFRSAGDTATVRATVTDANGHTIETPGVVWASADTSVAGVDRNGLVTAVSAGRTEVSGTLGTLTAGVVVIVESRTSISIRPPSLRFAALADTARLTVTDADGDVVDPARVRWTSGDSLVAMVGPDGLVTATGNGRTTISATSGSVSAEAAVIVEQSPADITIAPASLVLAVGTRSALEATLRDANGHALAAATVTWSSADTSVAAVDSTGLVTGVGPGSTEVRAASDSLAASAGIEVVAASSDRDVLELLYRTTGGDHWTDNTNWLTDAPLSDWAGVDTDRNGRVNYLALRDNNLSGPIPAAIGLLAELFILDLSGNPLHGRIPPEIGRLRQLRDLSLGRSDISGPLPAEMGDMAGLRYLYLSYSDVHGPLPDTFARLGLTRFYFGGTGLCVPPALGAWYAQLEDASESQPCIPVTPDREVLVNLFNATGGANWDDRDRWLSDHGLNTWHGVETNAEGYVTVLFLPYNNLVGPLPPALGGLAHLGVLALYGNELSGRIPPEFGKLTNLRRLSLSSNRLEGSIPSELGNLTRVDTLYLAGNALSGPIPPELWIF